MEKQNTQTADKESAKPKTSKVEVPSLEDMLKAGVQFGHESRRWNPKMKKYIFDTRKGIHVINLEKTQECIKQALDFLTNAASKGNIIFVGTKKQASDIIKNEAVRSGSFFVNARWAGGLLTNFGMIKKSLRKLNELEKSFEEGVEGRTKFEVSRMKKEWARLSRLYAGVKSMETRPTAAIVVDTRFERGAVKECRAMGIPVVALVDTNCDPESAEYIIPANDDAIKSISLILKALSDAVIEGNEGRGIKHNLKDYSELEVEIRKGKEVDVEDRGEMLKSSEASQSPAVANKAQKPTRTRTGAKGILERVQEQKEKSKKTK